MPTTDHCAFTAERLDVGPWHEMSRRYGLDLAVEVATILTEATTAGLPSEWHGNFTIDRARRWIRDRDAESPTLLAIDRGTEAAVGVLILFESSHPKLPGVELRIGYVIAERAWGQGYASELLAGLVEWARADERVRSLLGGVAADNPASAHVLRKRGFSRLPDTTTAEQVYELSFDTADPSGPG